jgi:hypothetical protein
MANSPTKDMVFDVMSVPKGQDVIFNMPELGNIESFKMYPGTPGGELNRDLVVKYVVILYSQDSILNKRIRVELEERKYKAADLAGFERNKKGEFHPNIISKLFNLESDYIVRMIVDFLIIQNNILWTEICTTEQEYAENLRLRFEAIEEDKDKDKYTAAKTKGAVRELCKGILKDLDEYYSRFFKDNDDVKNKHKKAQRMTLEQLAKGE